MCFISGVCFSFLSFLLLLEGGGRRERREKEAKVLVGLVVLGEERKVLVKRGKEKE